MCLYQYFGYYGYLESSALIIDAQDNVKLECVDNGNEID